MRKVKNIYNTINDISVCRALAISDMKEVTEGRWWFPVQCSQFSSVILIALFALSSFDIKIVMINN